MAQSPGSKKAGKSKAAKPTRAEKKALRAGKRQRRRETFSQMRQAFTMTRRNDPRLVPYLVLTFVLTATIVYLAVFFSIGGPWLAIVPAIVFGLVAAMFLFSRRAQSSAYSQAEGQPGAAAYVLGTRPTR